MSSVLVFAVILVTASAASLFTNRVLNDDYSENYLSPVGSPRVGSGSHDWMEVSQTTGRIVRVAAGQRVELECEVLGKPPPTAAQWFKGSTPITQVLGYDESTNMILLPPPRHLASSQKGFEESNLISGVGLGKLLSRYVIDCVQPHHRGVYTCRAMAGGQTRISSPSALLVEGVAACPQPKAVDKPPRIVTWSPLVLENMNNDVILPCSVQGSPQPKVYWVDENKELVGDSDDSRIKVSESGSLIISRLRWEDMGGYTCIAENSHGRDTRLTFLYPMLNEG